MHCSLFKFTLVLNSTLRLWKRLVFESLLDKSETLLLFNVCYSSKYCASVRCASGANVVCRDADVFGAQTVFLNDIL
jgi:hypothetical protein